MNRPRVTLPSPTERPTRKLLRYLRIGFSAICGLACLLAIMLWDRSYRYHTSVSFPLSSRRAAVADFQFGRAYLYTSQQRAPRWQVRTRRFNSPTEKTIAQLRQLEVAFGFGATQERGLFVTILPAWVLVAIPALLATTPWFRWTRRFSLRVLLIAITVIAMTLGIITYLNRKPFAPPINFGDFDTRQD